MDISTIIVFALIAVSAFFLVYVEVKSRRNTAKAQQSSSAQTVAETSTATEQRK